MAIPGDNPIRDPAADVLGRAGEAKKFARHVLELDASEGAVVGVFGPWGSGKTSFLNLARKEFEQNDIPVLDFNPWMFSGTEQLVRRFFDELSAELKIRNFAKIGKVFEDYGRAFTGVSGGLLKTVGVSIRRKGGIAERRKKIEETLQKRDNPIIVVLDDVDRLSPPEIRDIFKLVRLTASFPNIVYIVLCDRFRVEQALGEEGLPGRDYLEKIIQLPFDLPQAPSHILDQQLSDVIENALAGIENFDRSDELLPKVYREVVRPLIRNMRDVCRYAAAIGGTLAALEGKVALADVLGLEAVRVFMPDVFKLLPGTVGGLTVPPISRSDDEHLAGGREFDDQLMRQHKQSIEKLRGKPKREVVEAMIRILFPAGSRYSAIPQEDPSELLAALRNADERMPPARPLLAARRVAYEPILRCYLERVSGDDLLAFYDAGRAFELMTDCEALHQFMRSLDPSRWRNVIEHLMEFENRFQEKHVVPGTVVLLNLLPDIPEKSSFSPDVQPIVDRTVLRLLKVLKDADAVENAVRRRILPEVTMLSSRVGLVLNIGHRESAGGSKLVSETAAAEFEKVLYEEIGSASSDDLARNRNLTQVFGFAKVVADSSGRPLFKISVSPKLNFALLADYARTAWEGLETPSGWKDALERGQGYWDPLIEIYGGEEVLKARVENLRAQFEDLKPWIVETQKMDPDTAARLLDLADKFLSRTEPD